MKVKSGTLVLSILLFFASHICFSQVSFSLTPSTCPGNSLTTTATTGTLSALAYSWAALPPGPVFSAAGSSVTSILFPTAGTFTIAVGILTSGGISYASNTVIVNPFPQLTVTVSEDTICAPQTSTLTVTGASNYSWTSNTGFSASNTATANVNPATTTIYTVVGSNAGCENSGTVSVFVGTIPSATSGITASSLFVCFGEATATLSSTSPAVNYIWSSTNYTGTITQKSITAGFGIYTLTLSNGGGCTNTAICFISIMNCTGIPELNEKQNTYLIYPNPFDNALNINAYNKIIEEVDFLDIYGNLILTKKYFSLSEEKQSIECSELSEGTYFVRIKDNEKKIKSYKVFKK